MKKTLFILALIFPLLLNAQQTHYAKKIIETLASEQMQGRAYCTGGDKKAAEFLSQEMKKIRLIPFGKNYYQTFTLKKNCLTDSIFLFIDNQKLTLGQDYIIRGDAPSLAGSFYIYKLKNPKKWKKFARKKDRDTYFVVVDAKQIKKLKPKYKQQVRSAIFENRMQAAGVIILDENFYYSPRTYHKFYPLIYMKPKAMPIVAEKLWISTRSQVKDFRTQNLIGYVKGKSDKIIIITAHYDHLGRLGQIYFPGANDNASGTAMTLDIAQHFANRKTPPNYTLVFILFSGEEMGLLGSKYFIENPLFDLNKVKLVINLDMVGSGSKGITIVNGKDNMEIVNLMKKINSQANYLPEIAVRSNSPNSDHYPFTKAGINAIFIYTRGQYKEYHNIYDRADKLPLTKYAELKNLLIAFLNQYK